ncbi:MAG: hypothetical protein IJ204_06950 [Paludibacteraceae bacterium]|nr:hypothetical protein [Paludibacteraceae bacterium]
MKKRYFFLCIIIPFILSGCSAFQRKHQAGVAVELNGKYIYQSTLDSLTIGMNSEDSMRVAQQFISQWAKDILLYDKAKARVNPAIESLVEDYRRSLYVHDYEEYLVERNMPKTIPDSTVQQLYELLPDRFRLSESLVKGLLVIIPAEAPNQKKLRQWLSEVNDTKEDIKAQAMDNIEKYAYRYASGYELFTDKWFTTSQITSNTSIEQNELENRLKQTGELIEIADSTTIYLLQISRKALQGEAMPIEYARPEIEELILSRRQVEFLQKERERLYNEAVQEKKVKFY